MISEPKDVKVWDIMWEHFKPIKEKVARVTEGHLPFHAFVAQRREEWCKHSRLLGEHLQTNDVPPCFDGLLRPARAMVARLWPHAPQEIGGALVVPRRPRVLFFHGQKTDSQVANHLLKAQGWLQPYLDFVILDGPHSIDADTDPVQLQRVGLTQLVAENKYTPGGKYTEWCANFDVFLDIRLHGRQTPLTPEEERSEEVRYAAALDYLEQMAKAHGPFDAVAGFCQGAAFAQVALCKQRQGRDLGLGNVRMMIAMAPWQCPYHESIGLFQEQLQIPLLVLQGSKDHSADALSMSKLYYIIYFQ